MKNLQNLDDFRKLGKDSLIEEMMKGTIKGGCCEGTYNLDGARVDWRNTETGEVGTEPFLNQR